MAQTTVTTTAKSTAEPAELVIELKDPRLAAFLAWLVPGLGHFYQGRTAKGVLFFVCILGTFFYGLYIGNGQVVYASTPSILTRWQYLFQLGVGLPATPALVQRQRALEGKAPLPLFGDVMRPPRAQSDPSRDLAGHEVLHPDEIAKWNHDSADMFEMGTVYTIVAGLLNLLVICDAFGGPLVIHPPDDKKKRPDDSKKDGAKQAEKPT
ncbi:MAG: DUF6677 family protein [Pirellulales bacterium]